MNEKEAKLGTGKKFAKLAAELGKKPGVTDPAALAAAIGRKKYGKEKFQRMAAAGKRAKAKESVDDLIDKVLEGSDPYDLINNVIEKE